MELTPVTGRSPHCGQRTSGSPG